MSESGDSALGCSDRFGSSYTVKSKVSEFGRLEVPNFVLIEDALMLSKNLLFLMKFSILIVKIPCDLLLRSFARVSQVVRREAPFSKMSNISFLFRTIFSDKSWT
jgi:hypothetical protein